MERLPDALFVVDVGYEKIALAEARKLGIPVVAVVDSNNSPEQVDYVIPGNDDAVRAIQLYVDAAADSIQTGKSTGSVQESADFVEVKAAEAPAAESASASEAAPAETPAAATPAAEAAPAVAEPATAEPEPAAPAPAADPAADDETPPAS